MVNKILEQYDNPLDIIIYKHIDKNLYFYYNLGLTPNDLTTISLISGLSSVYFAYNEQYIAASILWSIAYYYDCADGKLARKYNLTSKFGDLYDHVSDIIKHGLMFYVLYNKISRKSFTTKFILISILCIISLLTVSQIGCQEKLSENKNSPTLSSAKLFIFMKDCKEQTKYTKYFSPVTISTYIIILMLSINKI